MSLQTLRLNVDRLQTIKLLNGGFQETKLITDKTYKKVQENSACLAEIEEILRKDRRFLVLEAAAAERTRLLMGYLEELARRGPPPPPTASEPSRRPTTK